MPTANLPPSLVEPMPMSAGIYYDEEFRNHHVENDTPKYSNLVADSDILTGPASMKFFDRIFSDLFVKTTTVEEHWAKFEGRENLNAIVQPRILNLRTNWHEEGVSMIESVTISYSVTFYAPDGTQLRSWTVQGDGRTSQMTGFSSLEDAIGLAMRDAGAKLIVAIYADPLIRTCLAPGPGGSRGGDEFRQCITEQ